MERDWLNDWAGFFGALLRNGGLTPNGSVDTAQSSQLYSALIGGIIKSAGLRDVGTGAGQIPDMSSFNGSRSSNGYQLIPGGLIVQWGISSQSTGGSDPFVVFPIPFPTAVLHLSTSDYIDVTNRPVTRTMWQANTVNRLNFQALQMGTLTQTAVNTAPTLTIPVPSSCPWFAIGY